MVCHLAVGRGGVAAARSCAAPGRAVQLHGLIKPLVLGPLLFWQKPLPPQILRETLLGPIVMSLAWLYAAYALWDTWRKKGKRA